MRHETFSQGPTGNDIIHVKKCVAYKSQRNAREPHEQLHGEEIFSSVTKKSQSSIASEKFQQT
jgi:hypothetical protein